jgi:hypothetical protein
VNIDELWWAYRQGKEETMPAPHDLDPPAMTEAERLEKKRQDAAIGFELDANRMTSAYVDDRTIHHTMPS